MERRKFVGLFGVGMLASSFPMILAACSGNNTTTPETTTPETTAPTDNTGANNSPIDKAENAADTLSNYTVVGSMATLTEAGSIATDINGKKVLVFRNPTTQSIVALDPTCNHKGCPVKLAETDLACTCHSSRFTFDGALTGGPATANLPLYEVKEEGENILVKVV